MTSTSRETCGSRGSRIRTATSWPCSTVDRNGRGEFILVGPSSPPETFQAPTVPEPPKLGLVHAPREPEFSRPTVEFLLRELAHEPPHPVWHPRGVEHGLRMPAPRKLGVVHESHGVGRRLREGVKGRPDLARHKLETVRRRTAPAPQDKLNRDMPPTSQKPAGDHPLGPPASLPAQLTSTPQTSPSSPNTPSAPSFPTTPWYSRGFLPHFDHPNLIQSLTFRLHDAVPQPLVESWKAELARNKTLSPENRDAKLRKLIAKYEDAGHGACHLRDPRIASLVENTLLYFDAQRYRLIAWCLMPNHVHALIEMGETYPLASIAHSWKSFTSQKANQILKRSGDFWFREYYDRFIRDEQHFANAVTYIERNPVKARLVGSPEEWRWSSAWRKWKDKKKVSESLVP